MWQQRAHAYDWLSSLYFVIFIEADTACITVQKVVESNNEHIN